MSGKRSLAVIFARDNPEAVALDLVEPFFAEAFAGLSWGERRASRQGTRMRRHARGIGGQERAGQCTRLSNPRITEALGG